MSPSALVALGVFLALVVVLALLARPRDATTLDFYLAGRRIGVVTNACAICGDYFSAASFLGVAAAVYTSGLDGVWYATGFAGGFVPVLLFVAAPLRRFGEFSIPDFLGRRLESETVRLTAVAAVQLVILTYLVPQAVASGITWQLLLDVGFAGLTPYDTGVVVATTVVAALVTLGGMRGTTWTQAVQFLFLLAALLWLTAAVLGSGFSYPDSVEELRAEPLVNPVPVGDGFVVEAAPNRLDPGRPARFSHPGARYSPLGQFALVVTLVLGTAGLPHVMNRYFTSPTGRGARATTVWVLGLAGLFYTLAVLLGTAARDVVDDAATRHAWVAERTVDGVLVVSEHALLVLGRLYGAAPGLVVVALGALVAVMSTIAGLLLASAASWGHDVYERHLNADATQQQAVRAGRLAVLVASVLSAAVALRLHPETLAPEFASLVATMVTWAFALAGSALTPVLLLAIWWPRLSAAGAVAGVVSGACTALALFVAGALEGVPDALSLTPTIVAAPAAVVSAVVVSLATAPPARTEALWLRLHGTAADRQAERLARLTLEAARAQGPGRPRWGP